MENDTEATGGQASTISFEKQLLFLPTINLVNIFCGDFLNRLFKKLCNIINTLQHMKYHTYLRKHK